MISKRKGRFRRQIPIQFRRSTHSSDIEGHLVFVKGEMRQSWLKRNLREYYDSLEYLERPAPPDLLPPASFVVHSCSTLVPYIVLGSWKSGWRKDEEDVRREQWEMKLLLSQTDFNEINKSLYHKRYNYTGRKLSPRDLFNWCVCLLGKLVSGSRNADELSESLSNISPFLFTINFSTRISTRRISIFFYLMNPPLVALSLGWDEFLKVYSF